VHHELVDHAALYVVGALTGADKSAFEAHLSQCAVCMAEVREFAPVVEALAAAMPNATPEARVRRTLMARLSADSSI
jgi:anti-sigma factor RsiW